MCFMSLILHQKRGNKHFTIFPSTDLILRNFVQYCCLASIIHHLLMSRIKDVPYLNYNCLQNILAKRIRPHYVFGPGGLRAPSAFHPLKGYSQGEIPEPVPTPSRWSIGLLFCFGLLEYLNYCFR